MLSTDTINYIMKGALPSCNVFWKMTATNYWPPPRKASVYCSVVAVCKPLAQPRISVLLSGSLSDWVTIINTIFREFITCQDKQLSFKKLKLSIKKKAMPGQFCFPRNTRFNLMTWFIVRVIP